MHPRQLSAHNVLHNLLCHDDVLQARPGQRALDACAAAPDW
jgi:hypothetical protein